MMAFLLQALLWLVAAFLLGFAISRFLKSLFCRDNPTQDIYSGGMTAPPVDTGIPRTSVSAKTATALGGAAVAAAGAVAAARHKTTVDLPDVDVAVKAPQVDLPDVDVAVKTPQVDLPDVALKAPSVPAFDFSKIDPHKPIIDPPDVDWISSIDPHKPIIDPPDVEIGLPDMVLPEVSLPSVDINLPKVDLQAPQVDVVMPEVGLPDVTVPSVDVDLPDVPEVATPEVELSEPKLAVDLPEVGLPDVTVPSVDVDLPDIAVKTPGVAVDGGTDLWDVAKGAVAAAGAGLATKAASAFDFSKIDPHKPIIDPPDVDWISSIDPHKPIIDPPDVDWISSIDPHKPIIDPPDVDWISGIDPHKPIIDPPDVEIGLPDMALPEVSLPSVDISLPKVELQAPQLDVAIPELGLPDVTVPSVDVDLPDVPKVDLAEVTVPAVDVDLPDIAVKAPEIAVEADGGTDLWDVAIDPPDVQADMPNVVAMTGNWLRELVERTRAAHHGKHLRMVSRLWDVNAGYDCSSLAGEYEVLDLTASQYARMGVFHCGVTRDGFVSVGGDVATLAVGEAVLFHYPNIVVCRHADEEYRFIRIAA